MPDTKLDNTTEICVLFDVVNSPWGGGNQFLRTLSSELERLGLRVTNRPTPDSWAILINGFNCGANKHLQFRQVAQMRWRGKMTNLGRIIPEWVYALDRKRKGPPLIHRVDGVPEVVRGHKSNADGIQPAVNRLTDHTVFQTEYCKDSFIQHSESRPASWRVITNAVDPKVFFPNTNVSKNSGLLRVVAVSWSSNPRKGFSTLADFSRLPGVELSFVGNWCPSVPSADVRLLGVLRSEDLADVLRSSHAMLHAAWDEPCSNAIVEAMACGLPVIYRDSGGNRELAGDYGVPLADDLTDVLRDFQDQYEELRHKVLDAIETFQINRAAQEYISMFQYAIANHHSN